MAIFRAIFSLTILIYLTDAALGQGELRSALAAIDRRQKELADYEEQQQYGFSPYDQPDDLAFLSNSADGRTFDKDYLDDEGYEPLNKRFTTSFRERLEEDRKKQMEEFAKNLINNLESSGMPGVSDENYLRELWERYYGNDISNYGNALAKRAYYYPTYGIENVGLRKRNRYDGDEEPIYSIHHHVPRDDVSNDWINYLKDRRYLIKPYNQVRRSYGSTKRFAVTKRSNAFHGEQKRSVKKQTDPKVEKDLTSIFSGEHKSTEKETPSSTTPKPEKTKKYQETTTKKIEKKDNPKKEINKEVFAPVAPQSKKPLQIKKKSIDWSDYFGLDRRKKSGNNGLDKEWLMERYHKAVAVTAKKRNADLPLQSFRNHDNPVLDKDDAHKTEEQKINEMDSKLEKLEDEIVEDALKYTGAHQDDVDSKEVQQIKDNIISRLAQAYNIEKMRNALEEYKNEIEKAKKEVEKNRGTDRLLDDYVLEEKRLSVPRKEAVDNSRETVESDNDIKCISEDCHEQNYKTPSDIIDNHFVSLDQCPAIQRACNDVASIIGHYGHVFEAACNIHQMCLLCSNNSWFSPTRQCNVLFLSKAYELCLGKEECKKEARRSVRYLLDINKSLQAQSALNDECELHCPDTDAIAN